MAHQSKFVSVNLNRSYGQPSSSSTSAHGRSRPGSGGGGGGGGMVVLSRARSSSASAAKSAQKLAVPPPMNLPSLRKEHERFDPASSAAGPGHGSPALGSRTGPSALGWSKPALPPPVSLAEKDAGGRGQSQLGRTPISGDELAGGAYMPPGARPGGQPLNGAPAQGFSEKAVILRGEDFPSLRATFISAPKQKEASSQKQRQKQGIEDLLEGREVVSESHTPLQMRPQIRSSRLISCNVSDGDGGSIRPLGASEPSQKQDGYLPGLLPNVRLQHTSEWTDDERDTGLSIPERERDWGTSRSESVQFHDPYDGRGLRDPEVGSARHREFFKGDTFTRDAKLANSGQDFGSWRFPLNSKDRLNTNQFGADRDNHHARPLSGGRERFMEGVITQLSFGESGSNGFVTRSQDSRYARTGLASPEIARNGKVAEAFSGKNSDQNVRGHYNDNSNNWSKGGSFQNSTVSKVQFSTGSKGASLSDPMLNFGREKRSASSVGKTYRDDAEFDSRDPFSGGIVDMNVKVFKKKKDLEKQVDFPDPIRESFEAELERILRVQEQERQRVMEEQARALEIARKEEEERERLVREDEDRRRLLEEEAREAAWRAEQERLEATRRAEEQRIAREEEKKMYQMEEERRKEAARKKLMELEARIARRQAEDKEKDDRVPSSTAVSDELAPGPVKERDEPQVTEVGGWEDGDRMVEQITSSALSDSSPVDRYLDAGSRSQFPRDSAPSFVDRGKHSYGSTILPSLSLENAHRNTRQDAFGNRRVFLKKELYGGIGPICSRPSSKGSTVEPLQTSDEYRQPRKQRWNSSKEDYFKRSADMDPEIIDNVKFGDVGMAPGNSHGSPYASYSEMSSENSVVDEFSSFSRNRPFLRQPRVPPPPYVTSLQRSSFRNPAERSNSSCFVDDEAHYTNQSRYEQKSLQTDYDNAFHETVQQCETIAFLEGNAIHSPQEPEKMSPRCDSQMSLSVLSPPSSPALFSHHEMDVSRDSPPLPTSADGERTVVSDSEHIVLPLEGGTVDRMMTSRSVSPGVDDEWPVENNEEIQEQEEYYGVGDEYEDIAEAHEGDDDNLDPVKEIEDLQTDQVILGFNEGVEVKLPSIDKFEITSSNSKKEFRMQPDCSSSVEEPISTEETTLQEGNLDNSSTMTRETEKAFQDLSIDPVAASSYSINSVESSQSSVMSGQQTVVPAPSLSMASTVIDSPILSLPSTVVSQGEAPISLQFGLFSGPSLIPSPVPAIQIGSIQMPIHVHTQITPSLSQVHPSQPPLFQFGQLRYTPTISQSILPLAPHSTSFVQPPVPASYSFNQNPVGCSCNQASQNYSSQNKSRDGKPFNSSVKQSDLVQNNFESPKENLLSGQLKLDPGQRDMQNQTGMSTMGEKRSAHDSISQAEHHGDSHAMAKRSYRLIGKRKESQVQQPAELQSSRFFSGGKPPLSVGRRKRYAYSVKNVGSRSSFPVVDILQEDSNGFQRRARRNIRRTEFGVRENIERKQTEGLESLNNTGMDKKPNESSMGLGISVRNLGKKDVILNRSTKTIYESEKTNSGTSFSRVGNSDKKTEKIIGNEHASKSMTTTHTGKGHISDDLEEDVDAPLLSGVVRVFKQTGIEVPSNEDDFIEVRSKRQMLNDRREQRAKENKSKSRVHKAPGKQTSAVQSNAANSNSNSNKVAISSVGSNSIIASSNALVVEGKGSSKLEQSLVFTASQSLPPIGTPSVNVDLERRSNELKSNQTISVPAVSDGVPMLASGLLENKNINSEYSSLPSSSWDSVNSNHQVITLTQSQLEEAMKPSQFGSQVASNIVLEPHKPVSSVVTADIPFSSCSSPVNSLLAGEKIQFGAVMPPNILPPVSRAISKGFGHPDPGGSELKISQNLPTNYSMFYVKEKCPGEPCGNLEDAEAEAAASAIAVAAITNDEIVGSGIGTSSETKNFTSVDGSPLTSRGVASSQEVTGQSASEESLTVALPADLSVDTPLSVWPALPSPQTSEPMLSQFTGTQPSHFPSFEMNRILDGCTFAYGASDESAGSQGQSQKAAALGSGPQGTWPQYPSGVDSFYRPTAGFTGPFISPGGIPGVQCPPHMVFYNHFAPVGQFGQVGLGFMGATYIPAGKQPEWKQNQGSSTVGENSGGLSNTSVVSGQGTPTSMPMPNLGPGSPLMAVAPPLTMFDMSPFQPTANIPLQAWSHVPAPLHSIPLSMPLQQHHVESRIPSQFGWSLSGDASSGNNRFGESRLAVSAEINRNIPFPNPTASEISDDLGPMKQPTASTAGVQTTSKPSDGTASGSEKKVVPKTVVGPIGSSVGDSGGTATSNNGGGGQVAGVPSKIQQPTSSGQQQHPNPAGYADQQGGASQKTNSRGEWHRRGGFQVRKLSSGADKNIGPPKMKQIYVAKPSTSRPSNPGQTKI